MKSGQQLPDDFVELLTRWRETRDPRLPLLCHLARNRGWSLRVLAAPCGVTGERVRQWALTAGRFDGPMPPIPDPPLVPFPTPAPTVTERLGVDRVRRLRAMAEIARTVGGYHGVDHPHRELSLRFTAELAALIDQGYSPTQLAKVLGYTARGISYRLARHGYRANYPSMATTNVYRGIHAPQRGPRAPEKVCRKRLHALDGYNRAKAGAGYRCRACRTEYLIEYRKRKRGQ